MFFGFACSTRRIEFPATLNPSNFSRFVCELTVPLGSLWTQQTAGIGPPRAGRGGRLFSNSEHFFHRAMQAFQSRKLGSALRDLNDAESIGYDAALCAAVRWNCFMLLGEFEAAWRESDHILRSGSCSPNELWD